MKGPYYTFELTRDYGAALVTRHQTYPKDLDPRLASVFETYIKRHYKSWVAFARDKHPGETIRPILVSGVDVTKDFAMTSYSKEYTYPNINSSTVTPMFTSNAGSFTGK